MEELFNYFPSILTNKRGKVIAFFHLSAGLINERPGWYAEYIDYGGEVVNGLAAQGSTPTQALDELKDLTKVIELLRSPAIRVNEATGDMLPDVDTEG